MNIGGAILEEPAVVEEFLVALFRYNCRYNAEISLSPEPV